MAQVQQKKKAAAIPKDVAFGRKIKESKIPKLPRIESQANVLETPLQSMSKANKYGLQSAPNKNRQ